MNSNLTESDPDFLVGQAHNVDRGIKRTLRCCRKTSTLTLIFSHALRRSGKTQIATRIARDAIEEFRAIASCVTAANLRCVRGSARALAGC